MRSCWLRPLFIFLCILHSRCSERHLDPGLLNASMNLEIPRLGTSPRVGRCSVNKPYCSSDQKLTICSPNYVLIGNVTCPVKCREDDFGAYCCTQDTTTEKYSGTSILDIDETPESTTSKYSGLPPILDFNLTESAIKITSSLGLNPSNISLQKVVKPSGEISWKPDGLKSSHSESNSPVFDFNVSPEDYSHEEVHSDEVKPISSNSTVFKVQRPLSGNDSQVFRIEAMPPPAMEGLMTDYEEGNEGQPPLHPPSQNGGPTEPLKPEKVDLNEQGSKEGILERENLKKETNEVVVLLEKGQIETTHVIAEMEDGGESMKLRVPTQSTITDHSIQYLASVCKRAGLSCITPHILVECSQHLVPIKAWNCGALLPGSAAATCNAKKDSCEVTGGNAPPDGQFHEIDSGKTLCQKPGAQCADSTTLIHCSDDLHSATVAVCAELFPEAKNSAVCDNYADACIVRIGDEPKKGVMIHATDAKMPERPFQITLPSITTEIHKSPTHGNTNNILTPSPFTATPPPPSAAATTTATTTTASKENITENPHLSDDPSDAMIALFPTLRNTCKRPGLRCSGGRILEACEKGKPIPVYRMDCSIVMADILDARCEEQKSGEATCIVSMRRNLPSLKQGQTFEETPKEEIYTLELSVVDVTKSMESYESEIPSWKCSKSGRYCGDESTLLSCNTDLTLEFALSCGAIAPDSVVAFCDSKRDACVVKKISDFTSGENIQTSSNGGLNKTDVNETDTNAPGRPNSERPFPSMLNGTSGNSDDSEGQVFQPVTSEWDLSTISQLYPPDIPLDLYSSALSRNPFEATVDSTFSSSKLNKCAKKGPLCLDDFHLGSCSDRLELQYALPCSALYLTDPAPFCDHELSACLSSTYGKQSTKKFTPNPTTTEYPTSATTESTVTDEPPLPFNPEPLLPYPVHPQSSIGSPLAINRPPLQNSQSINSGLSSFMAGNYYSHPFPSPEAYTFFQQPNTQYPKQPSRLMLFLQSVLDRHGVLDSPQTLRPHRFPFLNNIMQSFSTSRPSNVVLQNTEYGEFQQQEPYNYNIPPYDYTNKFSSNYEPVVYHAVSPVSQWTGEGNRLQLAGVGPDMYRDILSHFASVIKPSKLDDSHSHPNRKKKPSIEQPHQSYFDRFLEKLVEPIPVRQMPSKLNLGPFKTPEDSSVYGRPMVKDVASTGMGPSSDIPGIAWLGNMETPDGKSPALCKRPGMQCVDSESLGACSRDLKLRYIIPCQNLLPFVSIGKPYCSYDNDACGVLVEDMKYPTDYMS